MTVVGRLTRLSIVVVALTAMAACRDASPRAGAMFSNNEYAVYVDTLDACGMTVVDEGGRETSIRLAVDTLDCPIGRLSAYEIFLSRVFIDPQGAKTHLAKLVDGRRPTDSPDSIAEIYPFPVTAPDLSWSAAVIDVFNSTGDADFLAGAARRASQLMATSRSIAYDSELHLYKGVTPSLIAPGRMPRWMTAADFAATISLRANFDCAKAMELMDLAERVGGRVPALADGRLSTARDTLVNSIDTYFWMPNVDCYAEALYCSPYQLQLPVTDNFAQAMGVVSGVVDLPIATALVARSPIYDGRVPDCYPSSSVGDGASSPLTAAMWGAAANRVGNRSALVAALSSLLNDYAKAIGDNRRREISRALNGIILRGLLGLSTTPDGLRFHPLVPEAMGAGMSFGGIRYRDAVIDVDINGRGNIISTFSIDGKAQDSPIVPADLRGRHSVVVTLVGHDGSRDATNVVEPATITAAPEVEWTTDRDALINSDKAARSPIDIDASTSLVYLNGAMVEEISRDQYVLYPHAPTTAVNFVAVNDANFPGFASPTHLYVPRGMTKTINVATLVRPGARSLKDKTLAKRYVESTQYKNAVIPFTVEVDSACRRYVQVVYLDGLGIVNPERRYATRLLTVNDRIAGLFVLPQLPPEAWRHDVDWQTLTATSTPIKVDLKKGVNHLSLNYYSPNRDDFNHDANALIPVKILVVPAP